MKIKNFTLAVIFGLTTLSVQAEVKSPLNVKLIAPNEPFFQEQTAQFSFMYKFTEGELKTLIMNYNEVVANAKELNRQYSSLVQNPNAGDDWINAKRPLDDAYKAFTKSGNKLAVQSDLSSMKGLNRVINSPKGQYLEIMKMNVLLLEDTISSYMKKAIRNAGQFGSRINADNLVLTLDSSTPFNVIMIGKEGSLDEPIIKLVDTTDPKNKSTLNIQTFETVASFSTNLAGYYINYSAGKNYRDNVSKE